MKNLKKARAVTTATGEEFKIEIEWRKKRKVHVLEITEKKREDDYLNDTRY